MPPDKLERLSELCKKLGVNVSIETIGSEGRQETFARIGKEGELWMPIKKSAKIEEIVFDILKQYKILTNGYLN